MGGVPPPRPRRHTAALPTPGQSPGLENPMDSIIHGVAKTQTRLSDFHSLTHSLDISVTLADQLKILSFGFPP